MNTQKSIEAWDNAARVCWQHVEIATALNELIAKLKLVQVGSIMVINSTLSPTLIVMLRQPDSRQELMTVTNAIATTLGLSPKAWAAVRSGDHWNFHLNLENKITIEVSTTIPWAQPTQSPI